MSRVLNQIACVTFLLQCTAFTFNSSDHIPANIALGKSYSSSPKPNNAATVDSISLTDGIFNSGTILNQGKSILWSKKRNIEITIDLENSCNISSVSFSTMRDQQKLINYPSHIYLFIGDDKDKLYFYGDIAANNENTPGSYKFQKFLLRDLHARGRFVTLEVIALGDVMYCDEIEVYDDSSQNTNAGKISVSSSKGYAKELYNIAIEKEFLKSLVSEGKNDKYQKDNTKEWSQKIDTATSMVEISTIENDVLMNRSMEYQKRFPGKSFLIDVVNPWLPYSKLYSPSETSAANISIKLPKYGTDYSALMMTNISSETRNGSVSLRSKIESGVDVEISHAAFIKSSAMEYVADPLIPLKNEFSLKPGESKMIFLSFRGKSSGEWKTSLKIVCGSSTADLPVNITVTDIGFAADYVLNATNWGYLDFKPIRNTKNEAVADLFNHHTKVVVVPSKYIPISYEKRNVDYTGFVTYLKYHSGASKILLLLQFNDKNNLNGRTAYPFLSDQWKEGFKRFYRGIIDASQQAGFTEEKIFLYPYDEMQKEQITEFIQFASWVKKEIPTVKLYATIDREEAIEAIPYLDIAQILDRDNLIKRAKQTKAELWLYDTKPITKSLSPYSYYRLMSWKAFYNNFKGVGFWNYSDTGWGDEPGTAWNDFDGIKSDFAVIYDPIDKEIISSRRWESWKLGIEDYELLMKYSAKIGKDNVQSLVETVVEHPEDVTRADFVRQSIVNALSKKTK